MHGSRRKQQGQDQRHLRMGDPKFKNLKCHVSNAWICNAQGNVMMTCVALIGFVDDNDFEQDLIPENPT
jgi:hypothetical protein